MKKNKNEAKSYKIKTEGSLVGLFFFMLSIIGIFNIGLLGNILSYSLSYLFGYLYLFVFINTAYFGFFAAFFKKRAPYFNGFNKFMFYLLFVLVLTLVSSFSTTFLLENLISSYTNFFSSLVSGSFIISVSNMFMLKGGLLGNFIYLLLLSFIGDLATKIALFMSIALISILLSKDVIYASYISIRNNKLVRKERKRVESEKKAKIKKEKGKVLGDDAKLTFDIFTQPLFDEEIEEDTVYKTNNVERESFQERKIRNEDKPVFEFKTKSDNEDIYNLLYENKSVIKDEETIIEVEENVKKINAKLEEFNIKAVVNNYVIGPCVTRYEIVPDIGVRVNSIVNIENDLKLTLAAIETRMEAPIPGKSAVGIEVANKNRYPVYLKEILTPYAKRSDKLLVGIGKDLSNEPVVINLDSMPHLLVAGATGSGKSVCLNSIILSLVLRTSPTDVRILLIDPKKVELAVYNDMPHLLSPVITDPKEASLALKKVIEEMNYRYDLFAENGVKNISSYNSKVSIQGKESLYNIVVIIDELADLMMVSSKDTEDSIQRITQLARAAGIYLVVATQRPSVDVITGIIKANIPSRIAFSVSSGVDSRTIIDRNGAETLLGKGDMLMDIAGSIGLNRVQGAYVSDEEISMVVEYIKNVYDLEYDEKFLHLDEDEDNSFLDDGSSDELLYEKIKMFVIENNRVSISLIQRKFSIGYSRAARMMDKLEKEKIVSKQEGSKPREVLVEGGNSDEEY